MSRILEAVEGRPEVQQRALLTVAASIDPYLHIIIEKAKAEIKGLDDIADLEIARIVGLILVGMHEPDVQAEVEAETKRLEAAAPAPAPSATMFQPKVKAQKTGTNYDA